MIEITDKNHQPDMTELETLAGPVFHDMCAELSAAHKALFSVEYSGDKVLLGWNVRCRKGGRTLCRLYPRRGYFSVLVVVGRKEKERVEALLPSLGGEFQSAYHDAKEGMGQRWLVLDISERQGVYDDIMKIVAIRRESK